MEGKCVLHIFCTKEKVDTDSINEEVERFPHVVGEGHGNMKVG